jgi:CD36 family
MPELSVGKEQDIVKVPNIPLLAALGKKITPVEETGLEIVLRLDTPKEFHDKTIEDFLFGYSDSFTDKIGISSKQAGLLASRKGESQKLWALERLIDLNSAVGRSGPKEF